MSLLESAAATLHARAHRDDKALLSLACAATRQRLMLLQDSLPPEQLWQWQQQPVTATGSDNTQLHIEQCFSKKSALPALSSPEFCVVEGSIRRARLRFASAESSITGETANINYYIIMEREVDGVWRYFNTTAEIASVGGETDGVTWFSSIGLAEDALRHDNRPRSGTFECGQSIGLKGVARGDDYGVADVGWDHAMSNRGDDGNDDNDDDGEDDYWAMYDSSTTDRSSIPAQHADDTSEDDYWARYDALDAQTPPQRQAQNTTAAAVSKAMTCDVGSGNSQVNFAHQPLRALADGKAHTLLLDNLRALRHVAEQYSISEDEFMHLARSVWQR
ncbi:hypothetical protein THASP1DRAFT_30464 [Thamnocephalis sphaerospora]|uniref:Uncharacterized protein n=1 Tax=Thamnocephalis sphaerospora TaxID=78915 RepID=A0A4P9XPC3_9FUNG|nr:hypothetical protein THASP1DRAFT_30464 [Thamnocephalis sphaerospora]|eukprot:RKP07722.1 hypothetical protein THASP1DRAFT_30464 [Thamnocephalis sphaerospora]